MNKKSKIQEKRKETCFEQRKKNKIQEEKGNTLSTKEKNLLTTKEKEERSQDLNHAIDQRKQKQVLRSYFFFFNKFPPLNISKLLLERNTEFLSTLYYFLFGPDYRKPCNFEWLTVC